MLSAEKRSSKIMIARTPIFRIHAIRKTNGRKAVVLYAVARLWKTHQTI